MLGEGLIGTDPNVVGVAYLAETPQVSATVLFYDNTPRNVHGHPGPHAAIVLGAKGGALSLRVFSEMGDSIELDVDHKSSNTTRFWSWSC